MNYYNSRVYKSDLLNSVSSIINVEKLKNSGVLITGATGILGSFTADSLIMLNEEYGYNISLYLLSRNESRLCQRFIEFKDKDYVSLIAQDVKAELNLDIKADYIIHAASNAYPAAFDLYPVDTIMSNIYGTYNLLKSAEKNGVKRFIFVSTGEVYGGSDTPKPMNEEYCGYVDSMSPRSCYPNAKRAGETLCASYAKQYGVDFCVVRPCHIYGPNFVENDNRAAAQFIMSAYKKEPIRLNSSGEQVRSFCYAADAVSALLTVMLNGGSQMAYNLSNQNSVCSIFDFAQLCAELGGSDFSFKQPDDADIRQRTPIKNQVLDNARLLSLGWKPMYALSQGINNSIKILGEANENQG